MKILQINTRYIGGGGAAYIANILHQNINSLDGFSSTFLYGRGQDGDAQSHRIIYENMDYVSALSYRIFSKEINLNKDIETYIKECDIVHLHNIHGYFIDYRNLFKLLKKYNKKIVWTLHDMWAITGRCAYSFNCEKWKISCGKCDNKESYPKTMFDRSYIELKNKKNLIGAIDSDKMIIVTPSKWLGNLCKQSYLNKFNIYNIANGIEYIDVKKTKFELRNEYDLPINKKIVLFVAADTRDQRKGINYILDIIPKCKDYIFVSIGKCLENITFNNFIQLGYINNRDKINEIYSMADLFVISSLDENFPTTVIESFANGIPVIGFNKGGIPEQISDEVGVLIKDINSNTLKNEIIKLLKNEKKLNFYSNNSRSKFNNNYKLEIFINSYLDLYKKYVKF